PRRLSPVLYGGTMSRPTSSTLLPVLTAAALALSFALPASAAAEQPDKRAALIGAPSELIIQPAGVTLAGPRACQQVLVTGKYADGSVRDLTGVCDIKSEAADLVSIEAGYICAKKNGSSSLVVTAGGKTAKVPLTVKDVDKPQPVSFRNEVI